MFKSTFNVDKERCPHDRTSHKANFILFIPSNLPRLLEAISRTLGYKNILFLLGRGRFVSV